MKLDHVQVERETRMLRLLAAMVDGYNAIKYFQAHSLDVELGKCKDCSNATNIAIIFGIGNDNQSLSDFRDALCPKMKDVVDQIVAAERISRDVCQAITEVEKRFNKAAEN